MTDGLHAAVTALIDPRRVRLLRDHGTDWATIPSLWQQLTDATGTGNEAQRGSSRWRTPVDLDILELRHEITEVVHDALTGHEQLPRPDLPASLRLLAVTVAGVGDDDLTAWWTWRIQSWVRRVERALGLTGEPQPRRIRDTACPACQTTHVTIDADGDQQRVPALLIDFTGTLVRAAQCDACGTVWFRGGDLLQLADTIKANAGTSSEDHVA
ncbi:MAG: zf-TFIIB domain-containing protein [Streptosporangiales bacterium]